MVHQIRGTKNYFISEAGFVFKIENGKEVKVKPRLTPKSKEVRVFIDNRDYNLLNLMIEYFIGDLKPTDTIRHKVNKDLEINLTSIKIRPALGNSGLSRERESLLNKYNCQIKATSANARAIDKITGIEVLKTLEVSDFKCVYCNTDLKPHNFHLDHFQSFFKGGKNVFANLVASCNRCNIMKGALEGKEFYLHCKRVAEKYLYKSDIPGKI